MSETALKTADGTPVFVRDDGSYAEEFPREHIVRHEGEVEGYLVYGFVGDHGDFEEQNWAFDTDDEAVEFASDIYGRDDVDDFEREGEVFEVEVHEVTGST